ncbi:MAG: DNA polymerase III subunit beta, partial [Gemmataceae bacterium]|nr:DNA polymerase III subunit beta [Gemmataceae bacterium]
MKVVCQREGLLAACQLASAAVATRDVKPVLRNLKAVVDDERCTLMATDLELGIRLDVRGVKVEQPGEALLPTTRFLAILRESTDEELLLEGNIESCVVRGTHNEFEMPGEDPSAFPDIPVFSEEKYHELTAGVLREMIRRVAFAAAHAEHARFSATTGVLWELEGAKASLVATDGRRLALMNGEAEAHGGHSTRGQTAVVPVKAMSLLERNLTEPSERVKISVRQNDILMKTERAMIYSRLVEGRFPNYRQVLPTHHQTKVSLTVGPFLSAVRQAAIMTDEECKRVTFSFAKKKLTLQARGAETGRSRVEMPLDFDGKAVEISFDPKFLVDMLRVLEPDVSLTLEMTDGAMPVIFRHGSEYLYVVVPVLSRGVEPRTDRRKTAADERRDEDAAGG